MADVFLSPEEQGSLAARIQSGDRSAEVDLVRWFGGRILALLIARTRDPDAAQDLFQEVMLAALSSLRTGQLREPEKLAAYLQGTARNVANGYIRGRMLRRFKDDPIPIDLAAATESDAAEGVEREEMVRRALGDLDQIDRDILTRTLVDGSKPGEIASLLGLSSEAVRQRKSRAVKKVADYIRNASQTKAGRH